MKQIKFRFWDEGKKDMYYWDMRNGQIFIQRGELDFRPDHIIMQYTGLKDKKGKEIYEGDIVEIDGGGEPFNVSVGFEDGCFIINAPWIKSGGMPELKAYTLFADLEEDKVFKDCVRVKVIGNIYQNEELLK